MKILFVCTGNTCRSPMAEGILNKLAKEKNLSVRGSSAGIMTMDGLEASRNSILAMEKIGIDISKHRSRQVNASLIETSDLILTMSRSHKMAILGSYEASRGKVFTLLEYAKNISKDILDPYGRELEVYENTREEIKGAIEECLKR